MDGFCLSLVFMALVLQFQALLLSFLDLLHLFDECFLFVDVGSQLSELCVVGKNLSPHNCSLRTGAAFVDVFTVDVLDLGLQGLDLCLLYPDVSLGFFLSLYQLDILLLDLFFLSDMADLSLIDPQSLLQC